MVLYLVVRQPLTYLLGMNQDQFNAVSSLLYGSVRDYSTGRRRWPRMSSLRHDEIVSAIPELSNMPLIDFTFLGVNLSQTPHFLFWQQENVGQAFGLWLIPVISAALGVVSMIITNHINANVLHTRKSTMDQSAKMTMIIMPCSPCGSALPCLLPWACTGSATACLPCSVSLPTSLPPLLPEEAGRGSGTAKERGPGTGRPGTESPGRSQEEGRRGAPPHPDGAKLNKSIATASREGPRTYARGRMYDPDRYPTFPYQDPNKLAKLEEIERQRQEEEKASAKKSKGKKGAKGESSLPESPSPQEETKETPVSTLDQAPSCRPLPPAEPAAEEVEETFVEESFLEEAEEDQNEKK